MFNLLAIAMRENGDLTPNPGVPVVYIVVSVVGAVVVLAGLVGGVLFFLYRKKHRVENVSGVPEEKEEEGYVKEQEQIMHVD